MPVMARGLAALLVAASSAQLVPVRAVGTVAASAAFAAGASLAETPRLMRKEVGKVSEELVEVEEAQPAAPPGYYNRVEDCVGAAMRCTSARKSYSHTSGCDVFESDVAVSDCANICSGMPRCVGFTFRADSATCYFKNNACNKTTNNGWSFYQKEACDLSQAACQRAALAAGLTLGGSGWQFAGQYSTTGCYSYSSGGYQGMAFYGWYRGGDVRIEQQLTALPANSNKFRPVGYGCQAPSLGQIEEHVDHGAHSLMQVEEGQADSSAIRLEIHSGEDLILEDELERAAHAPRATAAAEPMQLEEIEAAEGEEEAEEGDDGLRIVEADDAEDIEQHGGPPPGHKP